MADRQEDRPLAEVYIDESSQTAHRYLVMGPIIVNIQDRDRICEALTEARLPELPSGTLKWTKVSKGKLPAYVRVVDAFFNLQRTHLLDFHALAVDTSKIRNDIYNNGSSDIGFNKEVYQLALKMSRLTNRSETFSAAAMSWIVETAPASSCRAI
jgi:hypothetical protein